MQVQLVPIVKTITGIYTINTDAVDLGYINNTATVNASTINSTVVSDTPMMEMILMEILLTMLHLLKSMPSQP